MKIVCKEQVDDDWEYTLSDGFKLSRDQWNARVLEYIQKNSAHERFEEIRVVAERTKWCKVDTVMDFALQLYGEQIDIEFTITTRPVFNLAFEEDKELGCKQLKFI
jgi:hypothetical protein